MVTVSFSCVPGSSVRPVYIGTNGFTEKKTFVHLIDAGGQPSFISLVPAFVRGSTVNIVASKLNHSINDKFQYEIHSDAIETGLIVTVVTSNCSGKNISELFTFCKPMEVESFNVTVVTVITEGCGRSTLIDEQSQFDSTCRVLQLQDDEEIVEFFESFKGAEEHMKIESADNLAYQLLHEHAFTFLAVVIALDIVFMILSIKWCKETLASTEEDTQLKDNNNKCSFCEEIHVPVFPLIFDVPDPYNEIECQVDSHEKEECGRTMMGCSYQCGAHLSCNLITEHECDMFHRRSMGVLMESMIDEQIEEMELKGNASRSHVQRKKRFGSIQTDLASSVAYQWTNKTVNQENVPLNTTEEHSAAESDIAYSTDNDEEDNAGFGHMSVKDLSELFTTGKGIEAAFAGAASLKSEVLFAQLTEALPSISAKWSSTFLPTGSSFADQLKNLVGVGGQVLQLTC